MRGAASVYRDWPAAPTWWDEGRTLCVSVPFTWNLPSVRAEVMNGTLFHDKILVGGPAVELMPEYLKGIPGVEIGHEMPGVLQRVNPQATRSTVGCVRKCGFCAIGRGLIEKGGFRCLEDWPDLPVYCDNNIFAAPIEHFDRVMNRLEKHGYGDFNQGVDPRLLNMHHILRIARVKKLIIRPSLDSKAETDVWMAAFEALRRAGVAVKRIRAYVLIGWLDDPEDAWKRCKMVEDLGAAVAPQWYHALDQMEPNIVTPKQEKLGWDDFERKRIMGWFYFRKELARAEA